MEVLLICFQGYVALQTAQCSPKKGSSLLARHALPASRCIKGVCNDLGHNDGGACWFGAHFLPGRHAQVIPLAYETAVQDFQDLPSSKLLVSTAEVP